MRELLSRTIVAAATASILACSHVAGATLLDSLLVDESVVEYDSTGYEIAADGSATWRRLTRIFVADEDDVDEATIAIFEDQYVEIKEFHAHLYDAEGKELHKWKQGDLSRQCGFGESFILYSDICHYFKRIEVKSYPVVVETEVAYKVAKDFTAFLPDFHAQREIPLVRGVYTLSTPNDYRFTVLSHGEFSPPDSLIAEKRSMWKWSVENAPAFESEPFMPPPSLFKNSIEFAPTSFELERFEFDASTWRTLAAGHAEMFASCYDLSSSQLAIINTLKSRNLPPQQLVADLHDTLSSRSRYIAVEIGLSGWLPRPASETFAKQYGDCKDLSTMYAAMLTGTNVDARPALILTRDQGMVAADYPKLGFNHVILTCIDGNDTTWIDPTCFDCLPGDLPWVDEDTYALVVDPVNGDLVRTPLSTADQNLAVRNTHIYPTVGSAGEFSLELTCTGNLGHRLRAGMPGLDKEEMFGVLKSYGLIEDDVTLTGVDQPPASPGLSEFSFAFHGGDRQQSVAIPGKLYVDLSLIPIFSPAETTDLRERRYPLHLAYPRTYLDTCTIHLPSGYVAGDLPESRSYVGAFGGGDISFAAHDSTISMVRTRFIDHYQIDTSEFEAFSQFLDSCRTILDPKLVLRKLQ